MTLYRLALTFRNQKCLLPKVTELNSLSKYMDQIIRDPDDWWELPLWGGWTVAKFQLEVAALSSSTTNWTQDGPLIHLYSWNQAKLYTELKKRWTLLMFKRYDWRYGKWSWSRIGDLDLDFFFFLEEGIEEESSCSSSSFPKKWRLVI